MEKIFILFSILLLLPAHVLAYETDYYSANLSNYTAEYTEYDSIVFLDNSTSASNIEIFPHSVSLGSKVTYDDIYNQITLATYKQQLYKTFQETVSNNVTITKSTIENFGNYSSFSFLFTTQIFENSNYFSWYYIIFSDNYMYEININSSDINYLNTYNIQQFINSFKIKDTTKLLTKSAKIETTQQTNTVSTTEYQSPYKNYTILTFILDVLLTAIIYLTFPLILRFGFKKSFSSMKALWISFANFILIKIVLYSVILDVEINAYSAWWYLFIGQAILTQKKDNDISVETTHSNQEDDISPIDDEVLNILSDKERIKNILDDKEVIDESLFIGIENPFNNKKIENLTDIKEYLYSFYLR